MQEAHHVPNYRMREVISQRDLVLAPREESHVHHCQHCLFTFTRLVLETINFQYEETFCPTRPKHVTFNVRQ